MSQLELPVISDAELWQRMLDEIRDVCRAETHKEVSFALDMTGSELSNALAERDRNHLKMRSFPYFLRHRRSDELLRLMVEFCGRELGAPRPLTAAEKLSRLEEALARAGAAGEAILADAYGRKR